MAFITICTNTNHEHNNQGIQTMKKPIIGIMGAMEEEVRDIRMLMTDVTQINLGNREFYIGKINGYDVVLVFSRWGKVAATSTAAALINQFKIDSIIFTGVAGAIDSRLNIGDVVVAEKSFQHDMDARPLMPHHEIPLTGKKYFVATPKLVEIAENATDSLLNSLPEHISSELLQQFKITSPKRVTGTMATGDQFIYKVESTQRILDDTPDATVADMETAAVGQICDEYGRKFVGIRVISDKADHNSELDFPRFIEKIAAIYSQSIINEMLKPELMSKYKA